MNMCLSASIFRPTIEYDQHRSSRSMNAQRRADGRHGFHHGGSVDTALHRLTLTPICSLRAESLWSGLLFLQPPCCPIFSSVIYRRLRCYWSPILVRPVMRSPARFGRCYASYLLAAWLLFAGRFAFVVAEGATQCASGQLDWYTSVVGETPCKSISSS